MQYILDKKIQKKLTIMSFPLKIKMIREKENLTRKAFASSIGVREGKIQKIELGAQRADHEFLSKLDKLYNVDFHWLLNDDISDQPDRVKERVTFQPIDDYTLIPRFDVEASAGAGAFVDAEHKRGEMAFRTDWLKQKRINPDHASVITVQGDSMKPTLETGDSLLVSTSPMTHDPIREGIYVINLDDLLMVKRLQKPRRDTINILSDNPAYPPITVTDPAAEKFHIIGRVVWYGRNLA